jgi:tetratricopeptide (TPR) repeat protein
LAILYESQGNYVEAVSFYKRALTILEKALGPEHPDVATSLNNLAGLCRILGNYTEAERHYQRALTVWEKALGPEHPNVAQCLENYAVVLRKMHREAEAVVLEARAQAIRAKHTQESPQN